MTRDGTHSPGGVARFTGGLALAVSVFAAAALLLGATTPVRSGRNCTGPCLVRPYEGAAAFVLRDYLWMYPAIVTAFVARFGSDLQDRFEIVAIGIDWSVLVVVGVLVGVASRRPRAWQSPPVGDVADVGPRDGSGVERRAVR